MWINSKLEDEEIRLLSSFLDSGEGIGECWLGIGARTAISNSCCICDSERMGPCCAYPTFVALSMMILGIWACIFWPFLLCANFKIFLCFYRKVVLLGHGKK